MVIHRYANGTDAGLQESVLSQNRKKREKKKKTKKELHAIATAGLLCSLLAMAAAAVMPGHAKCTLCSHTTALFVFFVPLLPRSQPPKTPVRCSVTETRTTKKKHPQNSETLNQRRVLHLVLIVRFRHI